MVKIDVEGAECHVLEGMHNTLSRYSPDLIIEITPDFLAALGKSVEDIDRLLLRHGYLLNVIEYDAIRPVDLLADVDLPQFNAFCTTRSDQP
jgi:hypothetical protein